MSGACWLETTTVCSRTGFKPSYSIATCVLPSGRRYGIVPSLRTAASRAANRWANAIGSGINSGVAVQAKPNIMPWSPAPCVSSLSSASPLRCSIAESTPWAMSGDWAPIETLTPQEAPSKPFFEESYPMPRIVSRTITGMSAYALVVTSPATCTWPVVNRRRATVLLRGFRWFRPSLRWADRGLAYGLVPDGPSGNHEIPHRVRDGVFRAFAEIGAPAVGVEHDRGVAVGAERLVDTHHIEHDQVCALAAQLVPCVRQCGGRLGGLGGEDDEHLAGRLAGTELGGDVGVGGQLQYRYGLRLLDLVRFVARRPEVGRGGGHHHRVGAGRRFEGRFAQLLGAA